MLAPAALSLVITIFQERVEPDKALGIWARSPDQRQRSASFSAAC